MGEKKERVDNKVKMSKRRGERDKEQERIHLLHHGEKTHVYVMAIWIPLSQTPHPM